MDMGSTLKAVKQCFQEIPEQDSRAKVGPYDFVVALIFSLMKDSHKRSLETLRRSVQSITNQNLCRSTFWERLATKRLQKFLQLLVGRLIQKMGNTFSIGEKLLGLLGVSAILLLDSSSNTLPKDAKDEFPAPRKNVVPASIKLHLCFDLFRGAVSWFAMTEAKSHDRNSFPPIESLIGKLIIFDLGYWDYLLLASIKEVGGYFLSRVKSNAVIHVISVVQGLPKKKFEGKTLFGKRLPKKKMKIVEVLGEFHHHGKSVLEARVIGFWNPIGHEYHWYVTNLAAAAQLIYPLYRLRWQIELIFKNCKASFRMADQPSANAWIIRTLLLLTLAANLIAHPIGAIMTKELLEDKKIAVSFQRAGMVLLHLVVEFIRFLLIQSRSALQELVDKLKLFQKEFFDPNFNKRDSSLTKVLKMATSHV